jgi:outer membrane immunogenic protein
MKKFLCSTIACAAIFASAPAIAADVPIAYPPATAFGPNWTGFYFGAAFGGGWTHLNLNNVSSFTANTSQNISSVSNPTSSTGITSTSSSTSTLSQTSTSTSSASGSKFGGTFADLMVGYSLLVSPSWVAGVQVEGTLSDMIFHAEGTSNSSLSSSQIFNANSQPPGPITNSISNSITNSISSAEFAVKMQWATAAIARLGWLVTPSTLLYATGGATYAGFGSGFNSDTFRAWGWSAGAGVEQKFGSNWSVTRV